MTQRGSRGFALVTILFVAACGSDSSGPSGSALVPISFSSQQAWCAGFTPGIVTVTELLGPRGATLANTTPGDYIARGTYNLPPANTPSNVVIELTFAGSVVTAQNGESVAEQNFSVPAGSRQGTFEVRGGFLSRSNGTGRPGILASSGSSALDCIELY